MTEISDDIDFMKGIKDDNSGYSLYLLCKLKSRKLIVFQNLNNNLINISNNIEYNKDLSIVNFGEIVVNDNDNDDNNNFKEKYIVLFFDTETKIYNKKFELILTLNNNFLNQNNSLNITDARVGENLCLIYNKSEKKYFLSKKIFFIRII